MLFSCKGWSDTPVEIFTITPRPLCIGNVAWRKRERVLLTVCKAKVGDQKPGGREGLGTRLGLNWRRNGGLCEGLN